MAKGKKEGMRRKERLKKREKIIKNEIIRKDNEDSLCYEAEQLRALELNVYIHRKNPNNKTLVSY